MNLKTYTMPRELFLGEFVDIFGKENMDIYESRLWRIAIDEYSNHVVGDFVITWTEEDDRWYITHLKSLSTISWRGLDNIGRENLLSHQMSCEQFSEFVTQLKFALDVHKFIRV